MKLEHSHQPEAIHERLAANKKVSYLRDFIYGSIDGIITTFAIIAGVMGAGLSNKTIIILGFANILADGFSMAMSNYLGTKAEIDEIEMIREHELSQVEHSPEGEKEEVRQIFKAKGFSGETLEKIVSVISQNETEWLKIMLAEEYGLTQTNRKAEVAGLTTFAAFLIFGLLPLVPFLLPFENAFLISMLLAGFSFFIVGSFKSFWSLDGFWVSGLKTLLLGSVASAIAYYTGYFLEQIIS